MWRATPSLEYSLDSQDRRLAIAWLVPEAKQRFSEMVRRALDEAPQVVTHGGEEAAVGVSADEFRRLTGQRPDFKEFLLSGPDFSVLDLERVRDLPCEIKL